MGSGNSALETTAASQTPVGQESFLPLSLLGRRLALFARRDAAADMRPLVLKERTFGQDTPIWASRENQRHIGVLEEGWAYRFTIMRKGQRHIGEFYGPGSIVNWSRLSAFDEQDDILFKAGTRVSYLHKDKLQSLLQEIPGLETAVERHELARVLRASQRIRALISLRATDRLISLLLDLANEYQAAGHSKEWSPLPFVQSEIADFVGLSTVHVSRTFRDLVEGGVIKRSLASFRFLNRRETEAALGYRSYYNAPGSS